MINEFKMFLKIKASTSRSSSVGSEILDNAIASLFFKSVFVNGGSFGFTEV